MVYVPTVPPMRGPAASPRAQDLGRRLKAEIEKFETQYPGTTPNEIRDAAGLAVGALASAPPGFTRTRRIIRAVMAVQGVAAIAFGVLAVQGNLTRSLLQLFVALTIGGTALIVAVAWALSRRAR